MAANVVGRWLDAHREMAAPKQADARYAMSATICTLTAFCLIYIVDRAFARKFKKPYFVLHVGANMVISALTVRGTIRSLLSPTTCTTPPADGGYVNALYMCWIYAIHIYHPIFFKTGAMDWIHHVPVYILNTIMFSVPSCDAIHFQAFILCGVPGGIDYLLQVVETEGHLSRSYYKEVCAQINMWVRAPLGVISSYTMLVGTYWGVHGWYNQFVLVLLALHAFWNPPFFCRQAVEANTVDTINRFALESGSIKLPKVRALSGKQPAPAKSRDAYPIGTQEPLKKTE